MKKILIVILFIIILLLLNNNNKNRDIENFDPYLIYNQYYDPSPNCYEDYQGKIKCIQYPIYNPFLIYPRSKSLLSYDQRDYPIVMPQYRILDSNYFIYP
jgi:hypothetical protein